MNLHLLPPFTLRSAGMTTSILQDTGIVTAKATSVTDPLSALLSCQGTQPLQAKEVQLKIWQSLLLYGCERVDFVACDKFYRNKAKCNPSWKTQIFFSLECSSSCTIHSTVGKFSTNVFLDILKNNWQTQDQIHKLLGKRYKEEFTGRDRQNTENCIFQNPLQHCCCSSQR